MLIADPRLHTKALINLLRAATLLVYEGKLTTAPASYPYDIVWPEPGMASRPSLAAQSRQFSKVIQITSVGTAQESAEGEVAAVMLALTDAVPVVEGRNCWPITQEFSQAVSPDPRSRTPGGDPLFYGVTGWRLSSVPAN